MKPGRKVKVPTEGTRVGQRPGQRETMRAASRSVDLDPYAKVVKGRADILSWHRLVGGGITMIEVSALELPPDMSSVPITDFAGKVKALPLSDKRRQDAPAVADLIDEQPQPTVLASVEALHKAEEALPGDAGAEQAPRHQVLRVWWNYGQGIDAVIAGRAEDAVGFFRSAAYGFARLGDKEQLENSVCMGACSEAALLAKQQEPEEAEKMLTKCRSLLDNNSEMGTEQRERIVGVELGIAEQRAAQKLRIGHQVEAEELLQESAQRVDEIAHSHQDDHDPATYGIWTGIAGNLRAQAALSTGMRMIGLYDFDNVAPKASAKAEEAAKLLADFSPPDAALTDFCAQMLSVVEELAPIMLRLMSWSSYSDKKKVP